MLRIVFYLSLEHVCGESMDQLVGNEILRLLKNLELDKGKLVRELNAT